MFLLCRPERASAHHLEVSRLELRPIRAGELRGRLLLAPRTFEVQPGEAATVLLNRLQANLELSVGEAPCLPSFELVELWTEASPSPGHLVDVRCGVASKARAVAVHVTWHDPSELLVSYPPTESSPQVSVLVSPGDQTTFMAHEAGHVEPANEASPTTAKPTASSAPLAEPALSDLLRLGVRHVLPSGFDHVLFVVALALATFRSLRTLVARLLVFTVTHGIALYLGALGLLLVPGEVIEPLIAATIVLVAVRAARASGPPARGPSSPRPHRRAVCDWPGLASIAVFGFVHGLGFAEAFRALQLDPTGLVVALVAFHVGIEAAQLTVLVAAVLCLTIFVRAPWGQKRGRAERAVSYAAWATAGLGALLFFSRILPVGT